MFTDVLCFESHSLFRVKNKADSVSNGAQRESFQRDTRMLQGIVGRIVLLWIHNYE